MFKSLFTSFLALCFIASFSINLYAQDSESEEPPISEEDFMAMYDAWADSLNGTFEYQTGTVTLQLNNEGTATLKIPEGFTFLNAESSQIVLTEVWGNPPSETMGLLFPPNCDMMTDSSYVIEISYDAMGYVKDKDAADIDYDELLESMQKDIEETNPQRAELGYSTYQLVGWASEPFYDAENKKLHWAKEVLFEGDETSTLNYSIRALGRKGVLEMNFISDISVLGEVKENIPQILASVDFDKGSTYAEFNPDIDEVAAYGIGGLIAGKVLAKAGFFALLAKFWKIIAVGVVAAFGVIRRFLTGRSAE